jgi:hypothetical protein
MSETSLAQRLEQLENRAALKTLVDNRDEYARWDGRWLIVKRVSNFAWRGRDEVPAVDGKPS